MSFIAKLNVQEWLKSSLQLIQLYRWDILKTKFIVPAV